MADGARGATSRGGPPANGAGDPSSRGGRPFERRRFAAWRARAGAAGYRVALLALRAWWVIARPRSNGVRCVLRHDGDILLVRHTYADRRWMLPGGRVRRGEDAAAAATREMAAELGVTCRDWTVTGCLAARTAYRRSSRGDAFRRHSTWYLAGEAQDRALRPRAAEIDAAAWFPPAALPADRSDALDEAGARGWL